MDRISSLLAYALLFAIILPHTHKRPFLSWLIPCSLHYMCHLTHKKKVGYYPTFVNKKLVGRYPTLQPLMLKPSAGGTIPYLHC